jgi:3D (Asp-Asp-Asp) domain-containing protein
MPGIRTKKNYKQWLSIPLILLCCVSPLAPMLGVPSQPAIAQSQSLSSLNSCSGGQSYEATMFALTERNSLLNFNPGQPGLINSTRFITGLSQGETVVGIDFRPATGQLYGVTTANRIYIINPFTGAATPVGTAALSTAVNGQSFGIDFNPVPDAIRFTSDADQDLRISPSTGAVLGVDGALSFAAGDANAGQNPNVVGSAYTNNFAGTAVTTLYGIDSNLDTLVTQGSIGGAPVSPNTGQLFTIGKLNVDTSGMVGFDIAPVTNAAFASLTPPGSRTSNLYSINLSTGAARLIGPIGGGRLIRGIAYAVRPENVYAVTASGKLISFNPGAPGVINRSLSISGLGSGESVVGIDFRPATGQLFALSNASRIYTINTRTGAATPVGGALFTPNLNGASFGFDFNPVPDAIRLVSDANQDMRISPNTGAVLGVDGMLAFANDTTNPNIGQDPNAGQDPNVVGVAYTNSFLGVSQTTLFGIDSNLNVLVRQGSINGGPVSPNTGTLFTVVGAGGVGSLGPGIDPNGVLGFDISSESGAALASFNTDNGTATQLFRINLTTGAATLMGTIAGGEIVLDIAIEVRSPEVFAVTPSNVLVTFNAATPSIMNSGRAIRGLSRNERIVGLDFRPATGQLYALSSSNRIYIILINSSSAIAVRVNRSSGFTLNGSNIGLDFNPVPDLIRVTSDADQNLRLNPNDGTVAGTDGNLAFAAGDANAGGNPSVVGSAYTNSQPSATATTLYGIDSNLNMLVTQGSAVGVTPAVSPNTGQLFTVGPLGQGVVAGAPVGFDIALRGGDPVSVTPSNGNAAFMSLTPQGSNRSMFYTVNLATGAARLIGPIGGLNEPVQGIAVGGFGRSFGYDICIQDDRSGSTLQFDSCTGDFQVTRCGSGGFIFTGKGDTNRVGNLVTLRADRIFALVNVSQTAQARSGLAVVKQGRIFTINDKDTTNNTCNCR